MQVTIDATLYSRVAKAIEEMIHAGTLRPGDRIPSVRHMSLQHKVSVPTVLQAYVLLENRQMIEARPRSGFYVRPRVSPRLKLPSAPSRLLSKQSLEEFPPLMALVHDVADPSVVPLGGANPSGELLPAQKLTRIAGAIGRRNPKAAVNYDPAPGCEKLRIELSRRSLEWGCHLHPDEFLMTFGATEAMHLALSAVTKPGDTVIVESPTYYGLLNMISTLKLNVVAIPARAESGIDVEAVAKALKREKVKAIVLIPNFNNPLGSLMAEENRVEMLRLADAHDIPIIEDDIYGDLSHEGQRPRALKALDNEGRVILCGSFSKTLAPGYRTGYAVSGKYHSKLVQLKTAWNFGSAPLPALTIAEFLRNGGYDHHLRKLRRTYEGQVLRMREAIGAEFPEDIKISDPKGGFVLWIELPERVDAMELFYAARRVGISIAPGDLFAPEREFRNFIRISCGHPWDARIEGAVGTLGKLVRRALG